MPPDIMAINIFYLSSVVVDDCSTQMGLEENYILLRCSLEKSRAKAIAFVTAV
jgi:hypothetical protein